jgi:hypothetical protein
MFLIYALKSFRYADVLKDAFGEVFIVDKLKIDLEQLEALILEKKPDWVIGVAKADRTSTFELYAGNKFNRNGSVTKNGRNEYELFIPEKNFKIKVRSKPTTTFCNWIAYKVAEFVEKSGLNAKTTFIHLDEKNVEELVELLNPNGFLPTQE